MKGILKIALGWGLVLALSMRASAKEAGYDVNVAAGAGVSGFIEDAADATKVGGAWDLRVRVRTPAMLGFEVGYVGSINGLSDHLASTTPDGFIVSDGFEANAVLSLLSHRSRLDPYVFLGAGYSRFDIVNGSAYNASLLRRKDDAFVVPSGLGASLVLSEKLLADARATYRAIFDEGLIYPSGRDHESANISQWGVTARVAYRF